MADLRQWTERLCKYLDTYRLLLDSYIIVRNSTMYVVLYIIMYTGIFY